MEIALADVETSSDDYAARFSGNAGEYILGIQTDLLLELIKKDAPLTILDVGGGHAQTAVPLVQNGYNVTVIGSSDICSARLPKSIPFRRGDLLSLPLDSSSFDSSLCFRFISHCDDWRMLIKELCRVSKKSVIIDYPTIRSFNIFTPFFFGLKRSIEGNTRPYTIFSDRQLIEAFKEEGFELKERIGQFVFPMVIHRIIQSKSFSKTIEGAARILGLNYIASPVIARFVRTNIS